MRSQSVVCRKGYRHSVISWLLCDKCELVSSKWPWTTEKSLNFDMTENDNLRKAHVCCCNYRHIWLVKRRLKQVGFEMLSGWIYGFRWMNEWRERIPDTWICNTEWARNKRQISAMNVQICGRGQSQYTGRNTRLEKLCKIWRRASMPQDVTACMLCSFLDIAIN